jgi:uncharacterized membrane protein
MNKYLKYSLITLFIIAICLVDNVFKNTPIQQAIGWISIAVIAILCLVYLITNKDNLKM